jgi:hypothetical protein
MNFLNEYVDSKAKVANTVEDLLRGKLKEIVEKGISQEYIADCINDSLDFHEYTEEESMRNYENRERMYSPPKKLMETKKEASSDQFSHKINAYKGSTSVVKSVYPSPLKPRHLEHKYSQ